MHAVVYALWLIKEIFAAGFRVAARALRPDIGFTPMVVRYPLRVTSDWEIFWFSTSITATPSTLSLGLREPSEPGGPRILLVQDAFGDDPAEITRGLASMEEHLAPHVRGIDHGVPGQGSATELPERFWDYTSPRTAGAGPRRGITHSHGENPGPRGASTDSRGETAGPTSTIDAERNAK